MTTVREINDPGDLVGLRPLWNALVERTEGASFFHSLVWLETYWKHFSTRKHLRVLVVYDKCEPIGIVPLVLRNVRRSEPVRVLTYPLDAWGNYYGPISADPLTSLTAALTYIRDRPRDWNILELPWVDVLADEGRTKLAFERAGLQAHCEGQEESGVLEFSTHATWDAYLASRSKNCRKHLRRKENKLAERGEVTFVRHRKSANDAVQVDPRWDLYEACETVARASWQHTSPSGTTLSKERFRRFYRDCHRAAAGRGEIDMSLLFVEGRPAAFQYAYLCRGCVISLKSAYDLEFELEGAGTVMKARVIADSFARGDLRYDMGPEYLQIKRPWLTHMRPIHRYVHLPPRSVAAQLVRGKRAIEHWWRSRPTPVGNP